MSSTATSLLPLGSIFRSLCAGRLGMKKTAISGDARFWVPWLHHYAVGFGIVPVEGLCGGAAVLDSGRSSGENPEYVNA